MFDCFLVVICNQMAERKKPMRKLIEPLHCNALCQLIWHCLQLDQHACTHTQSPKRCTHKMPFSKCVLLFRCHLKSSNWMQMPWIKMQNALKTICQQFSFQCGPNWKSVRQFSFVWWQHKILQRINYAKIMQLRRHIVCRSGRERSSKAAKVMSNKSGISFCHSHLRWQMVVMVVAAAQFTENELWYCCLNYANDTNGCKRRLS